MALEQNEEQEPEDIEMGYMTWGYYDPPLPRNSAKQVDVEALMNMEQQAARWNYLPRLHGNTQEVPEGDPAL